MYSVVMMMALSGTPVAPEFGRHGCCGCHGWYGYGCYGCYGCYGAWGCWGWGGGYYAGCYGCWGSPYGTVISPYHTVFHGYGGYVPYVISRQQTAAPVVAQNSRRATVIVSLPADAKLIVDGRTMRSTSGTRRFVTPPLPAGYTYQYVVRAEVVRDGQTLVSSQRVTVQPGRETRVALDFGSAAVARNP